MTNAIVASFLWNCHLHFTLHMRRRSCDEKGTIMAGGRLEVFKFGLYLLLPGALIVHLKKPEWYTNHVDPVCPCGILTYPLSLMLPMFSTGSVYFLQKR